MNNNMKNATENTAKNQTAAFLVTVVYMCVVAMAYGMRTTGGYGGR